MREPGLLSSAERNPESFNRAGITHMEKTFDLYEEESLLATQLLEGELSLARASK